MSGLGTAYVKVMKENTLICGFCSFMKGMKVLAIFNERVQDCLCGVRHYKCKNCHAFCFQIMQP